VLAIGLGAIASALAAAALAFALTGGSSSPSTTNASTLPGAGTVTRLFRGLPQDGTVLGPPKAPVTMVEYVDLQCPFCRSFELDVLPDIVRGYVRTGKLRIDARPVAVLGSDSERGRAAALAAAAQNRFYELSQLLYLNQGTENTGWLSESLIGSAYASIPGLDAQAAELGRGAGSVKADEQRIDAQATAFGLRQTPTILVGKTSGHLAEVNPDIASITAAITRALR